MATQKFVTPVFRISFPNLFTPQPGMNGGKPKYGCSAVWEPALFSDKEKVLWAEIGRALNEASLTRFKKPWKDLPANIKRGVRDGAEKEGLEGYGPGTKFANLTSMMRPGIVGPKLEPIGPDNGNADEIYPGCYCRATVNVYSYDSGGGKGVALGLMNVQKVRDGNRLDSRTNASEDFADFMEDFDGGTEETGVTQDDSPF